MADLARYIRIYDPAPEDDTVNKRAAAITAAVTQLRKNNDVAHLVGLGAATARTFEDRAAPEPLCSTLAAAIKKQASAFVSDGRELEIAVLSIVAVTELLEGSDTASNVSTKDVIGAALWSALSYQQPVDHRQLEELRQYLQTICSERTLKRAEVARNRIKPSSIPAANEGDLAQQGKSLTAATNVISALQSNAALDREEIDVLWWALGGRSPATGRPYESLASAARGVVRGVELGIQLRRLPARAHRSLALSGVAETETLTLAAVVEQLAEVKEALCSRIPARSVIAANPIVFPLLTAVLDGKATKGGPVKAVDEWCARALLEAGLASVCANPAPSL